jgi:hypothetical protein
MRAYLKNRRQAIKEQKEALHNPEHVPRQRLYSEQIDNSSSGFNQHGYQKSKNLLIAYKFLFRVHKISDG